MYLQEKGEKKRNGY